MDKRKAREWAIELSERQGPCSLATHRTAYEMAKNQAERHQLLSLSRQARGDDTALTKLTEWLMRSKPIALSAESDDLAAMHLAISEACQYARRHPRGYRRGIEVLPNFYDAATAKKLEALAISARTNNESLKNLARAFYTLSTGRNEAPSFQKIKDLPAWLASLENAQKLVKMGPKAATKWFLERYPRLSQAKRTGLIELTNHGAESSKAQQLLAVELYRLFEAETPVKVPKGYYETSTFEFTEAATRLAKKVKAHILDSQNLDRRIGALEKRLSR